MTIAFAKQQGFTLLELMISIVLGLLISAAAMQLFFTGQMSFLMQKGVSDIQDNGNFGLRYLTQEVRKMNYGQVNPMNDRLVHGGLVLTTRHTPLFPEVTDLSLESDEVPVNIPNTIPSTVDVPISRNGLPSNVQIAKVVDGSTTSTDALSDQLVIQYYADSAGNDCEGKAYEAGHYIIQRFFLREITDIHKNKSLVFSCEAGSYKKDSPTILKNGGSTDVFGTTDGQIIMYNVDHFHYLLGVSNQSNSADKRYITIENYQSLEEYPRPRINSIQLGLLVRSSENVGQTDLISDDQTFEILDQTVKFKVDPKNKSPKHLRQVLTQTVAIRNGLGVPDTAEGK